MTDEFSKVGHRRAKQAGRAAGTPPFCVAVHEAGRGVIDMVLDDLRFGEPGWISAIDVIAKATRP